MNTENDPVLQDAISLVQGIDASRNAEAIIRDEYIRLKSIMDNADRTGRMTIDLGLRGYRQKQASVRKNQELDFTCEQLTARLSQIDVPTNVIELITEHLGNNLRSNASEVRAVR